MFYIVIASANSVTGGSPSSLNYGRHFSMFKHLNAYSMLEWCQEKILHIKLLLHSSAIKFTQNITSSFVIINEYCVVAAVAAHPDCCVTVVSRRSWICVWCLLRNRCVCYRSTCATCDSFQDGQAKENRNEKFKCLQQRDPQLKPRSENNYLFQTLRKTCRGTARSTRLWSMIIMQLNAIKLNAICWPQSHRLRKLSLMLASRSERPCKFLCTINIYGCVSLQK